MAAFSLPGTVGASGIEAQDFTIYASAVSDYVFRGYSQSNQDPALQAGIDFEHPSGILAGLWASTIEFEPILGHGDRGDVEIYGFAGYGFDLGTRTALALTLERYEYPGDDSRFSYSYSEAALALRYATTSLVTSYSDDALGSGEQGATIELTHQHALPQAFRVGAGVGYYDLGSPFLKDYTYWNVDLAKALGRFEITLGYYDSDSRAEDLWGDLAGSRIVLGVSLRIL